MKAFYALLALILGFVCSASTAHAAEEWPGQDKYRRKVSTLSGIALTAEKALQRTALGIGCPLGVVGAALGVGTASAYHAVVGIPVSGALVRKMIVTENSICVKAWSKLEITLAECDRRVAAIEAVSQHKTPRSPTLFEVYFELRARARAARRANDAL